jgi:hypothetical protein
MARPKSDMKPEGPVKELYNEQLRTAMEAFGRGDAVQLFFDIRRRVPGSALWHWVKRRVPAENVDDLREFCHELVGPTGVYHEFDVKLVTADGKPAVDSSGVKVQPFHIPAQSEAPRDAALNIYTPAGVVNKDPEIEERKRALARARAEMDLLREQRALERERKRLERMEEEDEGEDEDYGPPMPYYSPMHQMGGYNPYAPPWMQQQRRDPMEVLLTVLPAILQALRPSSDSTDLVLKLLPLMQANGMKPGDIVHMFGPMVTEMGKAHAESSRVTMELMAQSEKEFRRKVFEFIMQTGNEDDIEKWRRILNLGTDTIGKVVAPFLRGRGKSAEKVEVPALPGTKPALPAPSSSSPAATAAEGPAAAVPPTDPAAEAAKVVKERITMFLKATEQEAHIGSDPAFIVEKLEDLYLSLPGPLREKLDTASIADVYKILHGYDAESVDRLFKAINADKEGRIKKWVIEFWEILRAPPEDGDDDEDGGEEGPELEPEPEPESVKR